MKINQVSKMTGKNVHIWIWLQEGKMMKAVLDLDTCVLKILDEDDNLILKRTGLNKKQVKEVENCIIKYGAKRLDSHTQSFRYL